MQFPASRNLHPLRQCAHPSINRIALLLQLLALGVEVFERSGEDFDEFVVFELGFEALIFREGEVDVDMDHVEVGIAEAGVCSCGLLLADLLQLCYLGYRGPLYGGSTVTLPFLFIPTRQLLSFGLRTVEHDRADLRRDPMISRFFSQFSDRALRC